MWPFDWLSGWPFSDAAAALDNIIGMLADLPVTLAEMALDVLMVALYPFVSLLDVVFEMFRNGYAHLAAFLNAIIGIPNLMLDILNTLLTGYVPDLVILVFGALFAIRTAQFVWKHVKGISIAGFKIG